MPSNINSLSGVCQRSTAKLKPASKTVKACSVRLKSSATESARMPGNGNSSAEQHGQTAAATNVHTTTTVKICSVFRDFHQLWDMGLMVSRPDTVHPFDLRMGLTFTPNESTQRPATHPNKQLKASHAPIAADKVGNMYHKHSHNAASTNVPMPTAIGNTLFKSQDKIQLQW